MRDKDFDMQLKQTECPVKVAEIVEKTIRAVYPHYYPSGAVQFFLDLHNERRIREALARENIYFAEVQVEMMFIDDYKAYISAETMMGPNSARILAELLDKYPLQLVLDDTILDLGCGTGLTSLIIAKETGAKVIANDLWISAEENRKRFAAWGVGDQITPVCEDANHLPFEKEQFRALISIDAYHYFAGSKGFFQEKILPFMKEDGVVLIGIPGLKDKYTGRAEELLSDWLGDDAGMFKSPKLWKELIGGSDQIESMNTWEMDCFDEAWDDWLATNNTFALGDRQYFETIIQPYTCLVGIYVRLRRTL